MTQPDPHTPPAAGPTPSRPPARGERVAVIVFAVALFLVAGVWAWLAAGFPFEPGEPCGGDALNLAQKLVALTAWIASLIGLAGGLSYPDTGGRWVARGTLAAAGCFVLWILLVSATSC